MTFNPQVWPWHWTDGCQNTRVHNFTCRLVYVESVMALASFLFAMLVTWTFGNGSMGRQLHKQTRVNLYANPPKVVGCIKIMDLQKKYFCCLTSKNKKYVIVAKITCCIRTKHSPMMNTIPDLLSILWHPLDQRESSYKCLKAPLGCEVFNVCLHQLFTPFSRL